MNWDTFSRLKILVWKKIFLFIEFIESVAFHSKRVRDHLSSRTNTSNNLFFFFFFFDTGAIGLKEIRNYGVIAFSLQKEIIDNETIIIISSESWKEIYLPEA